MSRLDCDGPAAAIGLGERFTRVAEVTIHDDLPWPGGPSAP
jgi:hypothetical protein